MLVNNRIAVIVLVGGCSAFAQPPDKTSNANAAQSIASRAHESTIFTSMTSDAFQKTVQEMGFECTRGKDKNGKDDSYFTFRAEGYKVAAFVPDPSFIELYSGFTDIVLTPAIVNEWNQMNRFSRAYIDKDGNPTLEDDLIVTGGVTRENVETFVKAFRDTVSRWARFAIDHQQKDAKKN